MVSPVAMQQNAESSLFVSVGAILLANVLPAILLSVVIWIFWRASRNQD